MDLPDWIDLVQWPAMAASVLAAWLVASNRKPRRNAGFWVFLASNVLWAGWGLHDGAWALIALQAALAGLNIRGVVKTEKPAPTQAQA
jgi:CHASE2 domain-containing sensor protein